jgi:ribosome biogenesis GTPase
MLPGHGVLIDTPGMRELQLWDTGEALSSAFADIAELAAGCRFRDCRHEAEPGCAVREAVQSGEVAESRLESYLKLVREQEYEFRRQDQNAQLEQKRRWKMLTKAANKRIKEKRE